jgi:hypothetical protein
VESHHCCSFQDFSDPDYTASPRAFAEAKYQRVREVKIAIEELKVVLLVGFRFVCL